MINVHANEDLTINELEQYWNPLLFVDNILSETKETQWLMAQRNEAGEVYLLERRRIKGVFLETLELNDFPLDVQASRFSLHLFSLGNIISFGISYLN
ncbi:uncharacterized protein DEA37_0004252 [Paragonimus westermani]|uniref:Neurotransmitter-gated ion-channel ligand-binding domain-containing protein n=1 Tax=Paragonimus westermani TaxID=34504 RepID=A0A5J4NXJ9_9TREM|nr:uncharacterized protein DEA37_0004252 [Paragonimus westermani]